MKILMHRKSFTFHEEWRNAIQDLPGCIRAEIYDAIVEYGLSGTIPVGMKPMVSIAFNFIKESIDNDNARYEAICKRNRENGMKSNGRPKTQENPEKPKKPTGLFGKEIPPIPPKEINKEDSSLSSESMSTTVDAGIDAQEFLKFFNDSIDNSRASIKKARDIKGQRLVMLKGRIKEYGRDAVFEVFDKASKSRFLNGHGNRGFLASIDWLLRPTNFLKTLEGNYDNLNNNEHGSDNRTDYQTTGNPSDDRLVADGLDLINEFKIKRANGH